MNQLRLMDDRIFLALNDWARHTVALHGPVLTYASYGVVVFGALLLAALVVSRHASSRDLAATGWPQSRCSSPWHSTSLSVVCSVRPARMRPIPASFGWRT